MTDPELLATVYAGLGDADRAFDELKRALSARDVRLIQLKVMPEFEALRADPRFKALLKEIGLED